MPTSLTYIILSTRGCSPWRPDADIGTGSPVARSIPTLLPCFQGPTTALRTPQEPRRSTAPRPYRLASSFQGHGALNRKDNSPLGCRQRARVFSRHRDCRSGRTPTSTGHGSGMSTGFPFTRTSGDRFTDVVCRESSSLRRTPLYKRTWTRQS